LGAFQENPLFPALASGLNQQTARLILADGFQREDGFGDHFSGPGIGALEATSGLVVFESGPEGHYIELVSVLDEGGPLVIFPSAAADSAHFRLSFS
jgi:hypothetical protein